MANNKTKSDRIHDKLPKALNTKNNTNWKAIIEALGEGDQSSADLLTEVIKQLFIKTASRPYIDKLGSNVNVERPRLIGMTDEDFRKYIPIVAYKPKQVKLILDKLLDVFFFKELTTAYILSSKWEPFIFEDGWQLEYKVDEYYDELIQFSSDYFEDINAVSANEIVSAINRQAKYSFAVKLDDSISKKTYIRLFTKTIGSKGSIRMTGGRANIALQFDGYNVDAGLSTNAEWTVTKIGDLITFTNTGGNDP
jgi:hypothetical protein